MDLLFQIRGDDNHEYLITFSVAIIKQLHSLHFLKLQSVHSHHHRPLPIAVVLQSYLLFIEFQTKPWNCPVESFYVFSLHHLKVPNKGRCTLWGSWHPTTAWGSSQTVQSKFLSIQDSTLSPCWKELQNKTCVSSTGCLFTVNRRAFCSPSPPLSPHTLGSAKDLPPTFHGSYPHSSAEEESQQQQRKEILQQQNGQRHVPTNSWKKQPLKATKIDKHQEPPKAQINGGWKHTRNFHYSLPCTSPVGHCLKLDVN